MHSPRTSVTGEITEVLKINSSPFERKDIAQPFKPRGWQLRPIKAIFACSRKKLLKHFQKKSGCKQPSSVVISAYQQAVSDQLNLLFI